MSDSNIPDPPWFVGEENESMANLCAEGRVFATIKGGRILNRASPGALARVICIAVNQMPRRAHETHQGLPDRR